jgi:3-phosphoshikimate 1-carboxyvinyltransferase
LHSRAHGPLAGDIRAPGDKSVSHRALILSALATGRSTVRGLLLADDVMRTAAALRQAGVAVARGDDGAWRVDGVGVGGLAEPSDVLDLGNSGTGARLLMGVLAAHPFASVLTGDESLRARPMARVAEPLARMGARIEGRDGMRLPIRVEGAIDPLPIEYRLPVPSAQVKSAVLLAGLNAPGTTTVIEPRPTRDHTERLLRLFGAEVSVNDAADGRRIALVGRPELEARDIEVPGDPSSAAFALVAACIVPGSVVTVRGVGVNPLRMGLFETLTEMGADIDIAPRGEKCGEPVADITAKSAALKGVTVPAERAPRMIDEYPVLAIAAACARGTTVMEGLGELRVKESDRLAAVERGLAANGIAVESGPDSLSIAGVAGAPPGGGRVATGLDHRIAMAFLVLGVAAAAPVEIDDSSMIATSYPEFAATMNGLGAAIAAP